MSVAGDEPTLVADENGRTELLPIGRFIDECIEGTRITERYRVVSVDQQAHTARFRPLKAVIKHANEEPLFHLKTRYGRSVKVTSSHSVFAYENGALVLKKGNEVKQGDLLVASRRLPRPEMRPEHVDLLTTFYRAGLADNLYVAGEDVQRVAAERTLSYVTQPAQWSEPRIALDADIWAALAARRRAVGMSQEQVAAAVGVVQSITVSHWERGENRPILSHFEGYLAAIGWQDHVVYDRVPAQIDQALLHDDLSKDARWREVSTYKPLNSFTPQEIAALGDNVLLTPQAHRAKSFARYLPISHELLWLLGWFAAKGSLSKHQVSLALGSRDERFIPALSAAITAVFGEQPRILRASDYDGIKLYFQSVVAAQLIRAWGLADKAHEKRLPDILLSLSEAQQLAFLEGYFLGDGSANGEHVSFTTCSPALKDGLLYLFGQLGIVAGVSEHEHASGVRSQEPGVRRTDVHPEGSHDEQEQTNATHIQGVQSYFMITIGGKEQLAATRALWRQHAEAAAIEAHLARPGHECQNFTAISDDLIGLNVTAIEEIAPLGEYVYDFSVEEDENFICGVGGLLAHNCDADVDGSHIRTLLLTFFFRHMRQLIANGHLYIAQPPLFQIKSGKDVVYTYSDAERDAYLAKLTPEQRERARIQRYKGLGEMNPEQLWETTMNPQNRVILQVTVDDAQRADETFIMLMGDLVPPRRKFIQTHASEVRDLDV
ncbi:helix-turn-helix domain-containing protein [Candidatus Gracilibacteria bacterium]|nr:helix-turn-helix domain-containing protein [Candidatus Gracilibacteria bacterium]